MKKNYVLLAVTLALLLTGCAPTQPEIANCVHGHVYGFWGGLWHGMIAPFALIVHLFDSGVAVYSHNNNGGWYDFGFLIGVGAFTASGTSTTRRR